MLRWVPALFVIVLSACGGNASLPAGSANHAVLSGACDYLSTPDFKSALGLQLIGYRSGPSCSYRDQHGNSCSIIVTKDPAQYATSKTGAAAYGAIESLPAGSRGFYSAQLQVPPAVWVFDFGFVKGDAFGGGLCGGRFGSANPKPLAVKLASLIASKL
jgi:hypothetical protein